MAFRRVLPLFALPIRSQAQNACRFLFNSARVPSPRLFSGLSIAIGSGIGFTSAVAYCEGKKVNWDQVKKDILSILEDSNHDDGHLGPFFIRLAWHASGTYDKNTKTGGSDGATMRFAPEANHGANAGLGEARKRLEKVAAKHPGISYSDLWIFASYVAVEDMGGPKIAFSPGRKDKPNGEHCTPNGRLPDADGRPGAGPITKPTTIAHIREIFYRMGFNDQEIVALSGAHALGRCHTDRSGYTGPWTRAPTTFSNEYFRLLLESKWVKKEWKGPLQYENTDGKDLMMLPTDLALIEDPDFRKWVEIYKRDEARFFADFAKAYKKLTELGCNSLENSGRRWWFF